MSNWTEVLTVVLSGGSLDQEQAAWAMKQIMTGEAPPARFGALMGALRTKGETVDEIVGMARIMRELSQKVEVDYPVVDTCGTGGDRSGSINVSTMAAFVAAGAGAKVAKHGNRAATSKCGSADVLEALGVRIDLGPEGVKRCIDEAGIGFCFAQVFHPSMRHAGPLRKELGVPTVFNFLGPLTNPAGAKYQALGVSDAKMAPKMVEALQVLGSVTVLAFRGRDGLDELSTTAPSDVWELKQGEITRYEFDPVDLGIKRAPMAALEGGSAESNAQVVHQVLEGGAGPDRDVVAVNAAAAILAAGLAEGMPEALALAGESLDSGKARVALASLIEVSNR